MKIVDGHPTLVFERKRSRDACRHLKILVDPALTYVECESCGEKLNPVWVLERMITQASHWKYRLEENRKTLEKLEKKKRTKCEHCGRFTTVNT